MRILAALAQATPKAHPLAVPLSKTLGPMLYVGLAVVVITFAAALIPSITASLRKRKQRRQLA
jgi:hypothetical protein